MGEKSYFLIYQGYTSPWLYCVEVYSFTGISFCNYHAARQEINSGIAGMEVQGGFDARA